MNLSLQRKLIFSVIAMLLLILIAIAGTRVITMFFKSNTDKLILEYHELHALQEIKIPLSKLAVIFGHLNYDTRNIPKAPVRELVKELHERIEQCNQVLTEAHNLKLLAQFEVIAA